MTFYEKLVISKKFLSNYLIYPTGTAFLLLLVVSVQCEQKWSWRKPVSDDVPVRKSKSIDSSSGGNSPSLLTPPLPLEPHSKDIKLVKKAELEAKLKDAQPRFIGGFKAKLCKLGFEKYVSFHIILLLLIKFYIQRVNI